MTDDLTTLRYVGDTIAENLRAAGFETTDDVLDADVDELAEISYIGESLAESILTGGETADKRGREPTVDEHIDEILRHARKPISDRGVFRLAPIGRSTHKEWMSKSGEPYETYQHRYNKARAEAEEQLVEDGLYGDADSSLVKFLLKATHDYEDKKSVDLDADVDQKITGDGFTVKFDE